MFSNFAIILDVVLFLALFLTMFYLSNTRKDLRNIRNYQKDLRHFSEYFSDALQRSEQSLKHLYAQKDHMSQNLQKHLHHAETILDDLKYATERAESTFRKISKVPPSYISTTPVEPLELKAHSEVLETAHRTSQHIRSQGIDSQQVAHSKRKEALMKVLSKLR